jgi:hypothetical protein
MMQVASSRGRQTPRDQVAWRFEAAVAATGAVETDFVVAGRRVRIRFAGAGMRERLEGALAHLKAHSPGEPDLRVGVWDSRSSGIEPPPTLGAPLEGDGTGPILYYEENGVRALSRWNTLSVVDFETSEGWFWAPEPAAMLSWDWASPMRAIFHWWLGRHGVLQVHGGAVGDESLGVLVVGRGGSGKSTTCLAALTGGLRYAGDDFVAIENGFPPRVHSLYSSGKLETHQILRFPALRTGVVNERREAEEKAIVYAAQSHPQAPVSSFELAAVLVPRVRADRPESTLVPASAAAALAALAPSTIFQLHPPQTDALRTMARLVATAPCYRLELGSDLDLIPDAIRRALEATR